MTLNQIDTRIAQPFALWCAQRVEHAVPSCSPLVRVIGEYIDGRAARVDLQHAVAQSEGAYGDHYQNSFGVTDASIDGDYAKASVAYAYSAVQNAAACALSGQAHFAAIAANDTASVASSRAGVGLVFDPSFDARRLRENDQCRQAVKSRAYHVEKSALAAQLSAMQSALG